MCQVLSSWLNSNIVFRRRVESPGGIESQKTPGSNRGNMKGAAKQL